jgi:hypothetical protein
MFLEAIVSPNAGYGKQSSHLKQILVYFLSLLRHRSQTSSTVYLRSNRVYFMEALMIDAGGPDHLSVGCKIPKGGYQSPISNKNLYVVPPGNLRMREYNF